jgi:hypothetical protein
MVVDGHLACADDMEAGALNHDRGAFIEADAEQAGVAVDNRRQIVLAVARDEVLIDGGFFEQPEAFFVPLGHHDGVAFGRAAHQVGPLNGSAGGTAAHYAAAREHGFDLALGAGIQVGIGEAPLPSAIEPDGVGGKQRGDESFRIGFGAVARVKHGDVGYAEVRCEALFGFRGIEVAIFAGGGDDDEAGRRPAGERDELLDDFGAELSASDNDEMTARRTKRSGLGRCSEEQRPGRKAKGGG